MLLLALLACAPTRTSSLADARNDLSWPRALLTTPDAAPADAQWLDSREADHYEKGHVPGAANAHWKELTAYDADGVWTALELDEAAALLASRGLSADRPVVVYDNWDTSWGGDGFLYWTLRQMGVEQVQVLDGGWSAWQAAGGKESTQTPTPGDFAVVQAQDFLATTERVRLASDSGSPVLLDVRTGAEFLAGHVPGAVHLPFTDAVSDGRILPPDQLTALFATAGLDDPNTPIITYCTGGIRAGHTFLALELMGFTQVQNYVGSWRAWGSADGPVEYGR